jgi:hypothetical protein
MEELEMTNPENVKNIAALLIQAGSAHHVYEQTVLKGVYDQDWPNWYADYLVQHALNSLLTRPLSVAEVSQLLASSTEQHKVVHSTQSWADYTAAHFANI